ncbi:MAG: APC family permease [Lactobacillaceae bacterium]|jgi:amino acid transporter|nr:APC family permease [Lactobacillaceae bacterium]
MIKFLKRIFIGKPLKTNEEGNQSLSKIKALAMLSSDALSSVAYGTEMITTALAAGSALALWMQLPIAALVLLLLAAITFSYVMIIHAYPSGGGAYIVAKTNWGNGAGLVAGGSLLVDYMLTVAVSVAAAANAITSAFPQLHSWSLAIAIFLVLALMIMNLRGLRESANFLMVPVYLFVISMIGMLLFGIWRVATGQYTPEEVATVTESAKNTGIILFLKAFSSGSSSLTGVEAISNAVPNFKEPKAKNASKTLLIMSLILAILFAGVTFLSYAYQINPLTSDNTVLSRIASITFGGDSSIGFYVIQFATAAILAVAANTGFSAFPMLSYAMANDKYMPHLFKDKGDRLGFSNGIAALSIGAIILLLIFKGEVEHLIPLYAVGVFVPFTLSQSGMIIHWYRERGSMWIGKSIINFVGAFISAFLVVTLFALHFTTVLPYLIIMPLIILFFVRVKKHYVSIANQLRVNPQQIKDMRKDYDGAMTIVLLGSVTKVTVSAVDYAKSISNDVIGMHVSFDTNKAKEEETQREFERYFPDIRYVDIHSSYRDVIAPTSEFISAMAGKAKKRNMSLTVLIPQFVPKHWYQNVLHNQTAYRLRRVFVKSEDITISSYYYQLEE